MTIDANTKIAAILKHQAAALEAIISISPSFQKLRNPFLRKLMAGRTSLMMAAKIGNCTLQDFFEKLKPLGFEIDKQLPITPATQQPTPIFMKALSKEIVSELDVRPILSAGSDPFPIILDNIKALLPGHTLKIINSFEPTPLIQLLKKKGMQTFVEILAPGYIQTYFYKPENLPAIAIIEEQTTDATWEVIMQKYADGLQELDVRHLEMPAPMFCILAELDKLLPEQALYVYHKRIPVFLLPELSQKGFGYRIREVSDNEIHLLIFKP